MRTGCLGSTSSALQSTPMYLQRSVSNATATGGEVTSIPISTMTAKAYRTGFAALEELL
jgi:hypothetical protein